MTLCKYIIQWNLNKLNTWVKNLYSTNIWYYLGPSWSWLYGSWIYNYQCNQCLSPLTWVLIPHRRVVLDTTLCDKVCQWLPAGRWFSPVSSTNKTYHCNITEILLKVALNTNDHNPNPDFIWTHVYCKQKTYLKGCPV